MVPFLNRLFAGLLLGLALAAPAAAAAPREPIEVLTDELSEVMRNADALGFQGRYERLAPVLTQTFDFGTMARIAAGRH